MLGSRHTDLEYLNLSVSQKEIMCLMHLDLSTVELGSGDTCQVYQLGSIDQLMAPVLRIRNHSMRRTVNHCDAMMQKFSGA